jgi:chorismate mutase/prephenate dehydrogenase
VTGPKRTLEDVRLDIDRTDRALVELLGRRATLVAEAFAIKTERGEALTDEGRERAILDAVAANGRALGLDPTELETLFRAVLRFARVGA